MTDEQGSEGHGQGEIERPRVLGGNQGVVTLELDDVFDLLSEPRCRLLLYYLSKREEVAALADVAECVARWEDDRPVTPERVDRVASELHHVHLPRLAADQVLEYDTRSNTVRFWGQPTLEEYLDHAAHQELDD